MREPIIKDSFPKTLFVYKRGGVDTAEIRGKQVAAALGTDAVSMAEFTAELASRYTVVIYVKHLPPREDLARVRDAGVRQVLDVLDNVAGWSLPSTQKRFFQKIGGERFRTRISQLSDR